MKFQQQILRHSKIKNKLQNTSNQFLIQLLSKQMAWLLEKVL